MAKIQLLFHFCLSLIDMSRLDGRTCQQVRIRSFFSGGKRPLHIFQLIPIYLKVICWPLKTF